MKRFHLLTLALAIMASALVSCTALDPRNRASSSKPLHQGSSALARLKSQPIVLPSFIKKPSLARLKSQTLSLPSFIKTPPSISSSLAKLKSKRFSLPSFSKKTPPLVEVRDAVASISNPRTSSPTAEALNSKAAKADAIAWNRIEKAEEEKRRISTKEKSLVPKDFEPGDLDAVDPLPSYGILPSLKAGDMTSIDNLDEGASLPPDIANLPPIPSLPTASSIPAPPAIPAPVPAYLRPADPLPALKNAE